MVEIVNFIELLINNKIDFNIRYICGGVQIFLHDDRFSVIHHKFSTGYRCGKIDIYDSLNDKEYSCLTGKEAYNIIFNLMSENKSWWKYLD